MTFDPLEVTKILPPPGMWLCEGGFIDQQFSSQHCSCADVPYLDVSLDETVGVSVYCSIIRNA